MPAAFARTHIESMSALDIDSNPFPCRLIGIVCTIGPASQTPEVLSKLYEAGCGIVRLNFSHGSYEYHKQTLENVRIAADRHWMPIAIALDTKGPEIRTGNIKGNASAEVELVIGKFVNLTVDDALKDLCDADTIWCDYKNIINVVTVDKRILLEDGNMSLIVREKGPTYLKCIVEYGGMLGSKKGINLPGTEVDLPPITDKDKEDLLFGVEQNVDIVFASFIRSGDGVRSIKHVLGEKGKRIKIISKIETYDGCRKFNEILEASDGIMVARGDLGVEIPFEKVFIAQKMMIARCMRAGKPIIVATQMLESMIKKSKPTRAEATDVANAILDGCDCVMLSAETAKGLYPVECVETQAKIAREAEAAIYHRQLFEELRMLTPKPTDVTKTSAMATVEAAIESMASVIIVLTMSGRSAQCVSSYRPRCPIIAITRDDVTARQLRVYKGIIPLYYKEPKINPWEKDVENRITAALKLAEKKEILKLNNFVIILSGSKPGSGNTDCVRVVQHSKK